MYTQLYIEIVYPLIFLTPVTLRKTASSLECVIHGCCGGMSKVTSYLTFQISLRVVTCANHVNRYKFFKHVVFNRKSP